MALFDHDSDCCTYLGVCVEDHGPYEGQYDLYVCISKEYGSFTLLARYSDDGPDYYSGTVFAASDRNPTLYEASRRAIALGIISQGDVDREVKGTYYD